jgi:hypothetical protein
MKRIFVVLTAASAVLAASGAAAGKVNIPKEGSYEFDFCVVGHGKTLSAGDKLFVMNYEVDANLRSTPPGRAFDRMGSRCYGVYVNLNGQPKESGMCELTDLDGDKWYMQYQGTWDGGGGTYKAVHGTGKYDGMTLEGEYRIDSSWGNASKEVSFQGCNPNKGTYKLK